MRVFITGYFLFLFSFLTAFAQTGEPWWYTLERGKNYFRSGNYGNAMIAFEDARRNREERFSRMEDDFILLLSMPEVRRLGDSLESIETFITEQHRTEAAAALAELYYRVPKQNLGGSADSALKELDRLKAYPEAEFWLGEVYRIEGELGLALNQYKKAYAGREFLEAPFFDLEILYNMSAVHRLRQEYQEMEKSLLEILASQSSNTEEGVPWTGDGGGLTQAAMFRILENDGALRFLTLYRYGGIRVEKAHRLLGIYYYASNRHGSAAEHLLYSFLIQNTLLINEAKRAQYDFTFTDLDGLLAVLEKRHDLLEWIEENQYFRTTYYLACALYATGRALPARQLWTFLSGRFEAGEWQGKAVGQLSGPYIERAVEMP